MKKSLLLLATLAIANTVDINWLRAQPGTPANSVVNYPGAGVIQAGDVWDSFLPQGYGPNYSEVSTAATLGVRRFLQMGNFDRGWSTPATHWPAAFPMTPYWIKDCYVLVYDPDSTWNRGPISSNPSFFQVSAERGGTANYSCFAQLTYKSTLNGVNDPARHYSIEPYFVDGAVRRHVVYEAGWPTNLGVDVVMRAHGFAAPNWDNLNDFVIVEVQLKNTGYLDINMDGTAEQLNHDIKALAFQMEEQSYMSVSSYGCGGRCVNDIVQTPYARQAGWVDNPDSTGSPWAFSMMFPSATTLNPAPGYGLTDIGFNGGTSKNYMDIHHGWVMIDVKAGGLPADRAQSTSSLPSKPTIFGTHPIGLGAQRGWYVSGGSVYWAGTMTDPRKMFYVTTGVWYQNGGQLSHNTDFTTLNLTPNSNFFSGGTTGDPTTFVLRTQNAQRPNGDFKSTNHFDQMSFEDGSATSTTLYPSGWGKWTLGCSNTENFDVDMFTGVGPFALKKDSTMTIVFATVAGYRLEGIQRSVRAARWCYEQNFQIPQPPPLPDVKVGAKLNGTIAVEWDNAAETDPEFAGYKIWRAAQADMSTYLNEGMRVVDLYEEQMTPGPRPASLFKPVNPKFDAFSKISSNATGGTYRPDTWGTWTLVNVVSKPALGSLPHAQSPGYTYLWTDHSVTPGSYWYYVSAYKEGLYAGPGGDQTNRIETHSTNRNGASGLWARTYPFAPSNPNFPKTPAGLKQIGAGVISQKSLAFNALDFGSVNLGSHRDLQFRLTNYSVDTMRADISADNPAFVPAASSVTANPGDSLTMCIRFVPSHVGGDSGHCTISLPGESVFYSLYLTGRGGSGTDAPLVSWEAIDAGATIMSNPLFTGYDNTGSVYSALMKAPGGTWQVRKHDASGIPVWTCAGTCVSGIPQVAGYIVDRSGYSTIGLSGPSAGPPYQGALTVGRISAAGQLSWLKSVPLNYDRLAGLNGIAVDPYGNAYATGSTYDAATGNRIQMTTARFTGAGLFDWVMNFNAPVTAPGDTETVGKSIAVDVAGNAYVTGFGGSFNYSNVVTLKYNAFGALQWAAFYKGAGYGRDFGVQVAVNQAGDVYVLAQSTGTGSVQTMVLLKYRGTDGALQWFDPYYIPSHVGEITSALQITQGGGIVVCGRSVLSDGTTDGIILRYTPAGVREILLQYDGATHSNDVATAIGEDQNGNLYVACNSAGALGYNEAVLLKFRNTGMLDWEGHYAVGNAGSTYLTNLAVDPAGDVATGGYATQAGVSGYSYFVAAFGQVPLSVSASNPGIPGSFILEQNYPNPFNPSTTIRYALPHRAAVSLVIFNTLGQEVATLVNAVEDAGYHEARFDGTRLASGVYFYRLRSGIVAQTRRLLIVK